MNLVGTFVWHVICALFWRRLRNLPMLLVVVAVYMILAGLRGINLNGLGAPFLFWHEDELTQFLSVAALGFFLEEWVYVGYLLDTDPKNPNPSKLFFDSDGSPRLREPNKLFYRALANAVACGLILCLIFASAAWLFRNRLTLPTDVNAGWVFLLLVIGLSCGIAGRFVIWLVIRKLEPWLAPIERPLLDRRSETWSASQIAQVAAAEDSTTAVEPPAEPDEARLDALAGYHRVALYKQGVSALILFVFCVLYWCLKWAGGGSVALYACVLLTMLVGGYGFVVFHRRRRYYEWIVLGAVVTVALLVILSQVVSRKLTGTQAIAGAQPIRNFMPGAGGEVTATAALSRVATEGKQQQIDLVGKVGAPPSDSTDRQTLKKWKELLQTSWENKKPPLVVIANSGGGIKAQVWSTVALNGIEQYLLKHNTKHGRLFPNHVRLVTGTSGGMVGAAYWTATVPPIDPNAPWKPENERQVHWEYTEPAKPAQSQSSPLTAERMIEAMSADTLSPIARQFFFNDFLGWPLNTACRGFYHRVVDARGIALEEAWEQIAPPMKQPFSSLAGGERAGWLPTLAFAPTIAEDGRRLLICNQPIEYILVSDLSGGRSSVAGYSARLLNPAHGMLLSTVTRLNANFPAVIDSPSVPPLQERFRVMDAGYIDNYGIVVATQWLHYNRNWLMENTGGVLLIQISAAHMERVDAIATKASEAPAVSGFVAASFNKTVHHQDMVIDRLAKQFNAEDPAFFKFVPLDYEGPASLSWYLTAAEKYSLLYPFLDEDEPGGDADLFRRSEFSEDFQRLVFSSGSADGKQRGNKLFHDRLKAFDDRLKTLDPTKPVLEQLDAVDRQWKRLKESRDTIPQQLEGIRKWWNNRGSVP